MTQTAVDTRCDPAADGRPEFDYAPVAPPAPVVSIVTGDAGDAAALDATATSIARQSLPAWEWIVAASALPPRWRDDPRVRAAGAPVAPFVLTLAAGDQLEPTALELWVWALATNPGLACATGLGVPGGGSTAIGLRRRDGGGRDTLLVPQPLVWPRTSTPSANGGVPWTEVPNPPDPVVTDTLPLAHRLAKRGPRVLLLAPWLSLGGADKFNLDLVAQLRAHGWAVTIATTLRGPHDWLAEFAALTPDIFVLHHFLGVADYPRAVRWLVESRQVDAVLVTHSEFGYFLLPYLRAHVPDVAYLDYCHVEEEHWKGGGYSRLSLVYDDWLDLRIVSSEHLQRWMVARGADAGRTVVCHTDVDVARWRPDPVRRAAARAGLALPDDVPVILYAGRLCAQKQPMVFADTLRRLAARGRRFVALVAGDGPDRTLLERAVRRDGLADAVRFLGPVPNAAMYDLLLAADVFFLPSTHEGISLAIYEAMATGTCVVAADVGGHRELVTPECGVLLPRATPDLEADGYADALDTLLGDPARRTAMAAAARARVEAGFRLEQMGDRMAALLDDAVRRARETPRPAPAPGRARAFAEQAVASIWTAQMAHSLDPYRTRWSTLAYFALRNLLLPVYQRAVGAERTWPAALKQAVKTRMLRS